jgi:hypothetical protein
MRALGLGVVLVASLTSTSTNAHADDARPKSEETAQLLSGLGAGVPAALMLTAFLASTPEDPFNRPLMYTGLATAAIAPSLGEIYAGEYVTVGMAARVVGVGLAAYALKHYTIATMCDIGGAPGSLGCKRLDSKAFPVLGLAAIAFVGGMAYDVEDADDAVDRWNTSHHLTAAPIILDGPTGPAPGLSVGGAF